MGLVSAVGLGMAKISHWSNSKGQLISKCPFGVKTSSKKPTNFFARISALASKKRLNQKSSVRESKQNHPISGIFVILPLLKDWGRNPYKNFVAFLENFKTPQFVLKLSDL